MPEIGVLSRRKPTEGEEDDIRFGFVTAKAMGGMDIGQTVVVKHKAVMAVEPSKAPTPAFAAAELSAVKNRSSSKWPNPIKTRVLMCRPSAGRRLCP